MLMRLYRKCLSLLCNLNGTSMKLLKHIPWISITPENSSYKANYISNLSQIVFRYKANYISNLHFKLIPDSFSIQSKLYFKPVPDIFPYKANYISSLYFKTISHETSVQTKLHFKSTQHDGIMQWQSTLRNNIFSNDIETTNNEKGKLIFPKHYLLSVYKSINAALHKAFCIKPK